MWDREKYAVSNFGITEERKWLMKHICELPLLFSFSSSSSSSYLPESKDSNFIYLFILVENGKGGDFLISLLSVGSRLSIIFISREKGREGVMSATWLVSLECSRFMSLHVVVTISKASLRIIAFVHGWDPYSLLDLLHKISCGEITGTFGSICTSSFCFLGRLFCGTTSTFGEINSVYLF